MAVKSFRTHVGTLYFRDVPKTLRDLFHAACARRGKSMKAVLLDFMKSYVKDDTKIRPVNPFKVKPNDRRPGTSGTPRKGGPGAP